MATKFLLHRNDSNTGGARREQEKEFVFDGAMFTVGSDATNDLVINGAAAEQAVVVREGDSLTLINSHDGTLLNGEGLRREAIHPLSHGDEISVGNYTVTVIEDEDQSNESEFLPTREIAHSREESNENMNRASGDGENLPARAEDSSVRVKPVGSETKTAGSFAAVLDTLRTEEDSFYFSVVSKNRETARVALEQTEIPLGADEKNQIVFDIKRMAVVFGVVRKDWSGIVLESNRKGAVFVNNEPLDSQSRRLRNDDRVSFAAPIDSALVLHEPSLLVALEPLLSTRAAANKGGALTTNKTKAAQKTKPKVPLFERTFFNHFSFVEMFSMVIATLIGAVLFFLFFELVFA
jgi:hypothetical protein